VEILARAAYHEHFGKRLWATWLWMREVCWWKSGFHRRVRPTGNVETSVLQVLGGVRRGGRRAFGFRRCSWERDWWRAGKIFGRLVAFLLFRDGSLFSFLAEGSLSFSFGRTSKRLVLEFWKEREVLHFGSRDGARQAGLAM
jgi:hypothetical protein